MFRVLNFHSNRARTKRTKFGPHKYFPLYSIWTIDSGISYTGSIGWRITDPSIRSNTESNPSLDWWQSQLSLSEDWGNHRSRHSNSKYFTYSFIHSDTFINFIHIYVRDLPQSFQVPRSIDSTTHTPVLQSHAQVHTKTVFLIQWFWVITSFCC